MFAGRMRLKTFLALVGLGVAGLGAAALAGMAFLGNELAERIPEPAPPSPVVSTPSVEIAPVEAPVAASGREVDPVVLAFAGQDLGADKRKDVTAGKPYKVNVYQDAGKATANRAKVDLDRDDKWDEKWTFGDDGVVTREVAPADDEVYTQTFVWTGSAWRDEAAPQESVGEPAGDAPVAASSLRDVDRAVLEWKGKALGADKRKDVTKGRPYKVNVYQDEGAAVMNRAKLDLDRDDKWDEKWTFDGETITRQVAPADDEQYTETYHWSGTDWQPAT